MTNEQYALVQEHWLKGTSTKLKDQSGDTYQNMILLGNSLGLTPAYDDDGNRYWTGSLNFRQKL